MSAAFVIMRQTNTFILQSCANYIKNFARSLLPIKAPMNKKIAKNQPDKDKDAMLEKSAPILHPPASLAP